MLLILAVEHFDVYPWDDPVGAGGPWPPQMVTFIIANNMSRNFLHKKCNKRNQMALPKSISGSARVLISTRFFRLTVWVTYRLYFQLDFGSRKMFNPIGIEILGHTFSKLGPSWLLRLPR